jgi:tripartite-type tricarboxylate transporter receptor subunit TctC
VKYFRSSNKQRAVIISASGLKEDHMQTRTTLLSGVLALALSAGTVLAQDQYPNRNIRIIVPTSPGAVTDILARSIGQAMSQSWGQPVIVDNRPGGDETLGADAAAKSPPDGYTLLLTSNSAVTAAPHYHSQMRYDSQKDLTPIFMLGQVTPVMVVPTSSPVRSVQDLIALAKSKPGELNYGSFGNGSYTHVAMEDFKLRTGTQMMHLPYRGAAPAYTALLRNETAVMIANLSGATGHADAGNVRIIAAAGANRAKLRPDLPTIAESGVPGFSTGAWWGIFGPANLPLPIDDKVRAEMTRMLGTPEMQKIFVANTMERVELTPAEFVKFIRDDLDNWGRQIKAAGIKPN